MELIETRQVIQARTFNGYHAGLAAAKASLNILNNGKHLDAESAYIKKCRKMVTLLIDAMSEIGVEVKQYGEVTCPYFIATSQELEKSSEFSAEIKNEGFKIQAMLFRENILTVPVLRAYPPISLSDEDLKIFEERLGKLGK